MSDKGILAFFLGFVLAILAFSARARGEEAPPRRQPGEVRLGHCSTPILVESDGVRGYLMRCSSGAFIWFPASMIDGGDAPVEPDQPEMETETQHG